MNPPEDNDVETESVEQEVEIDEVEPLNELEKPKKRRGRKPLSDAQKASLKKGREKAKLNQQRRMLLEKEQRLAEEGVIDVPNEPKEEEVEVVKVAKRKPKPKKKKVVYVEESESSSSEDEPEIVYKKKRKQKAVPATIPEEPPTVTAPSIIFK